MRVLILFSLLTTYLLATTFSSEFYEIDSIKKRKAEFISTLTPLIESENRKILSDRAFLKKLKRDRTILEDSKSKERFESISKTYKSSNLDKLLKRVDAIPTSLALAQAVIESAWGRSRFTKEANNIFGHWTYEERGIIPANRPKNATHKIKIFNSLEESIAEYMRNLNTHRAYREFRNLREKSDTFSGLLASTTMVNYSGIGKKYISSLKSIINSNSLNIYDRIEPIERVFALNMIQNRDLTTL